MISKTRILIPLLLMSAVAVAQDEADYTATIEEFRAIPAVAPYFASAYGYAVWPRIVRGGLGIGGATGRGHVYRGGTLSGSSRVVDVNIGLQAGGQAYKQIIFFEDQRAYDEFTREQFQFDAQASAVAVTASAQATAGTAGSQASSGTGRTSTAAAPGYVRGLQVFSMAIGGLMYQATIGGQKYNFEPVK
jgi:lipid-binding SYLF domain-containing protein